MDDSKPTEANPFVDKTKLRQAFDEASTYTQNYFTRFELIERAAFNLPIDNIFKNTKRNLPPVNDGTLSSIINTKASRLLKQVPTARIKHTNPALRIMFEYMLNNEIIPNMNLPHSAFEKSLEVVRRSLIYGNQPVLVHYRNDQDFRGYNGPDFFLPEIRDVIYAPGAKSMAEANVMYMIQYWTKGEIEKLILQLEKEPEAKRLQAGWKLEALKRATKQPSSNPNVTYGIAGPSTYYRGSDERAAEYIKLVNVYQRGIKSMFYSFAYEGQDDDGIVREWVNPDPTGEIPLTQMYFGTDAYNPMGRGIAEAGVYQQNYLDWLMNIVLYMYTYNTEPTTLSKGLRPLETIQIGIGKHNHIQDPDFEFDVIPIETTTLVNMPEIFGGIRAQIHQLVQAASSSISAGANVPSFSKTPQGVDLQAQAQQSEDNHLLEKYEIFMREVYKRALNQKLAVEKGKQEIKVDEETKRKLLNLPKFPARAKRRLERDNIVIFDFDQFVDEVVEIDIDPRSSSLLDNSNRQFRLERALELAAGSPEFARVVKTPAIARRLFFALEIPDPESLLRSEAELEDPGPPLSEAEKEEIAAMIEEFVANKTTEDPLISALKALGIKVELSKGEQDQLKTQLIGVKPDGAPTTEERKTDIEAIKALSQENVPEGAEGIVLPPEPPSGTPNTPFGERLVEGARSGLPPKENIRQALGGGPASPPPPAQPPQAPVA